MMSHILQVRNLPPGQPSTLSSFVLGRLPYQQKSGKQDLKYCQWIMHIIDIELLHRLFHLISPLNLQGI